MKIVEFILLLPLPLSSGYGEQLRARQQRYSGGPGCSCRETALHQIQEAHSKSLSRVPYTFLGILDDNKEIISPFDDGHYDIFSENDAAINAVEEVTRCAMETIEDMNCGCDPIAKYVPYVQPNITDFECCCDVNLVRDITIQRIEKMMEIGLLNPGAYSFTRISLEMLARSTCEIIADVYRPYKEGGQIQGMFGRGRSLASAGSKGARQKRLNGTFVDSIAQGLSQVSTRFYIYDDPTITQSHLVDLLRRLGGESYDTKFDHLKNDLLAERHALEALEKHPLRTWDASAASLYVVPTPITELLAYGCQADDCNWFDSAFQALSSHPIFQKTQGHGHVLISFHWLSFNPRYSQDVPALSRSYRRLQNVTVANFFDPFGAMELADKTKHSAKSGFVNLFPDEYPLTKGFSIGLGIGKTFEMEEPSLEKFMSSQNFIFYRTREGTSVYGSTPFRKAPLDEEVVKSLPRSSIGYDLSRDEWVRHLTDSKFCLVIRGDIPPSHALLHAVRAGCIPVVVSNYYQEYAGPFKSVLSMEDFCLFLDEDSFLDDPVGELNALQSIPTARIQKLLVNIRLVQSVVFPDHPNSMFVEAFLKEAAIADERLLPAHVSGTYVECLDGTVILSGKRFNYRYPSSLARGMARSLEGSSSDPNNPVVLVGIISSALNRDARHIIRETWAKRQSDIFFVVAGPWSFIEDEFKMYGDLLWLDDDEDFQHLSYKTQLFFHAAEQHVDSYDYVFKADDDSYVGIKEVKRILLDVNPDYWGQCVLEEENRQPVRDPDSKYFVSEDIYPAGKLYSPWATGQGYALSRKFNQCAVSKLANSTYMPMEDVATGILASQCNILCRNDTFYDWWQDNEDASKFIPVFHRSHLKNTKELVSVYWQELAKEHKWD